MTRDPLPDVLAIATDIGDRLEAAAISYVIAGSLASSVHGEPRTTMDVDVVADLRADSAERFVASLQSEYYVDTGAAREAVRTGGSFNAVHTAAGVKVDFFVVGSDAFDLERLRTRIAVALGPDSGKSLWMDTAEHTLLRKLEWYRRGGETSDRQWRDVRAIIAIQGATLNRAELEKWAVILGVSDLLHRCLSEA